jgi:hypothetical protein
MPDALISAWGMGYKRGGETPNAFAR